MTTGAGAGAGGNSISGGTQGTVVQAGHIEHLVVHQTPPPADEVTVAPPFGRRGTPLRGRAELLARLLDASGTHVLYGLGGVGKTSLALAAADVLARRGAPVWWVAAQDAGRLAGGLRAVARRVGVREDELASGQTADLLWERLAALPGPWLLVLDNADDLALLDGPGSLAAGTGWARAPRTSGLVLVTTRDGDPAAWGAGPVLHPLGALPGPEGARVLADRAGEQAGPATDAELLAVRLGGLPLALDSAGRYLASVAERPAFLRTDGEPATYGAYLAALGTGDLAVDRDGTLARIWAMSLRLLQDRGHARVEDVLRLLAGFADAPVPLRVFAPDRVDVPPGELWTCLQALDRLGLAALRADGEPVVTLHPLVRDAYRAERERLSAEAALDSEVPEEHGPLWPLLVPHLLDDLGPDAPEDVWAGAVLAVRSLNARGLVAAAGTAVERVRRGAADRLGDAHRTVREACFEHGRALLNAGREREALALLGELAAAVGVAVGADRPAAPTPAAAPDAAPALVPAEDSDLVFALQVRNELATALQQNGQLERARTEYAGALDGCARALGPDHWRTLACRHNLAVCLALLGRTQEALAELETVRAAESRTLGAEHPNALVTRENRAVLLLESGDRDLARAELAAVVAARHRLLGADHPHTLSARFNLARCLAPADALPELTAVLEARTRVLGPGHPVTVATRETLERLARTLPG
ncbi:tetratricopeptide repeat protein [Streptomyces sp. SKN60]|uniref:tetratricopeptide repeat protein n=1 Tax=Streptomyces sp. SKN60 TaxID=2855506 RepID=UPI002245DCF5|nr:tetratricopeptide repeat protein [Streptomyces sp. SKN60]MCX2181707.1 tetratricopeptide repeat protein [Streptomyces sp. SKN60]